MWRSVWLVAVGCSEVLDGTITTLLSNDMNNASAYQVHGPGERCCCAANASVGKPIDAELSQATLALLRLDDSTICHNMPFGSCDRYKGETSKNEQSNCQQQRIEWTLHGIRCRLTNKVSYSHLGEMPDRQQSGTTARLVRKQQA